MRIPRIYTTAALQTSSEVALDASACKHAKEVLRLKAGNAIILFNGDGFDYHGEITDIAKKSIHVAVTHQTEVENESAINIHLLQPVCRSDKMDWCLQKATELGVQQITLTPAVRASCSRAALVMPPVGITIAPRRAMAS